MRELFEFVFASTKRGLKGDLVQDLPDTALREFGAGAIGAVIGIGVVAAGAPLWVGAIVGGGVGGFVAPWLLRDVKIA